MYVQLYDGSSLRVKSDVGLMLYRVLFCIAISDFGIESKCDITKYANDTNILTRSNEYGLNSLQQYCKKVSEWCTLNSMQLNASKLVEMLINVKMNRTKVYLVLNEELIPEVTMFNLLGVHLNAKLP